MHQHGSWTRKWYNDLWCSDLTEIDDHWYLKTHTTCCATTLFVSSTAWRWTVQPWQRQRPHSTININQLLDVGNRIHIHAQPQQLLDSIFGQRSSFTFHFMESILHAAVGSTCNSLQALYCKLPTFMISIKYIREINAMKQNVCGKIY